MYDILFTLEVPIHHVCDESEEGLGLLSAENVDFNCVYLLRHQTSDSYKWPLDEDGKYRVRYAVYRSSSLYLPVERGAHEFNLESLFGVADPDTIFLGDLPSCMAQFNALQTLLSLEMCRLLPHRN